MFYKNYQQFVFYWEFNRHQKKFFVKFFKKSLKAGKNFLKNFTKKFLYFKSLTTII